MLPKQSSLAIIIFTLFFGLAVSMDIPSLINSKLQNPTNQDDSSSDVTVAGKNNSKMVDIVEKSAIRSDYSKHESRTKFSASDQGGSVQDKADKPSYPKPTIKLLVFKKHSDKQFYKMPTNLTYA